MKNVHEFLKYQVVSNKTPSVQYAFFNIDAIVCEGKYGLSDVKSNTPVSSLTTYNLFSVTKTFTALAVLQLAQAGKLELSDNVSDYLSEMPYSEKMTVEQLLNHSAGIPNPLPLRWIHLSTEHQGFNRDSFFKAIFNKYPKLAAKPGSIFKYSNLGYVLLGQLIEKVSGQTFEAYITENILEPCGISAGTLGFEIDPTVHAVGYQKWWSFNNAILGLLIDKKKFMGAKEGDWKPFNHFYTNGTPYGGMVGTGNALIKYAQALLRKDSLLLNDIYKSLLFTESVINKVPTGMSLSWYTGALKGHKYLAHAGGGGGYYVELRIYPALGMGSVIMFNRSGMTDERILDKTDSYFLTDSSRILANGN
ncbi:MAG: beta-lactamase family protein [Saprospiraceae bacterium]|nr:beta-lactamase family protein [Saprospiraceae bacterium]